MKKEGRLWSAVLAVLLLAGCGGGREPAVSETDPVESEEESPMPASAREAYAQALEKLMNDYILPDGTDHSVDFDPEYGGPLGTMEENLFAVADVDGDGGEELVLQYLTTSNAGQRGLVSSWDPSGGLKTTEFANPALVFYENGAVREDWSHNQGKGGRQWPFFLYRYLPESDSYEEVGALDAWDSDIPADGFPREIDTSGAGIVYYIYPAELDSSQWDAVEPVDQSVYLTWLNETLHGSQELGLTYLPLTEENVRSLTAAGEHLNTTLEER